MRGELGRRNIDRRERFGKVCRQVGGDGGIGVLAHRHHRHGLDGGLGLRNGREREGVRERIGQRVHDRGCPVDVLRFDLASPAPYEQEDDQRDGKGDGD